MKYDIGLFLAAALPAVHGVAFAVPEPTAIDAHRVFGGMSPKPTVPPSPNELKKRQSLDPETCGWVDSDFSSPVACSSGRTCKLYKSAALGMAGCCVGSDTQNCGWASSCIDKKSVDAGNCGTNCQANTFIRKCTDAIAPYCVTWTYPSNGVADYGCESISSNTVYTVRQTATDDVGDTTSKTLPTVAAAGITFSTDSPISYNTAKKLAIGTIVGIVIAVLALIFFAVVGVCVIIKRKKKQKQIAANAQIVANAQASRPQSQFNPMAPPGPPQQMQQGPPPPPMPAQSPQPTLNGYFSPPGQQDQKYNGHTSVHEYAMTPISNPPTPAPAYAQPHNQNQSAPPMPQQHMGQYQPPANGAHEVASPVQQQNTFAYAHPNSQAHEVDATSVPQAPGNARPVYEMGGR